VLADGAILRASENENKDLFWAIRGAGSSFAVATEFVIQAFDQPNPVWAGTLAFHPDKLEDIVKFANKHHEVAGENEALMVSISRPPPAFQPAVLVMPFYNGPEDKAKQYFGDLLALGPVMNYMSMIPYEKLNGLSNAGATFGDRKSSGSSAVTCPLDPKFLQNIFDEFVEFVDTHPGAEPSLIAIFFVPFKKIQSVA